ncbi:hypothetical protein CLV28_2969 [Sediminihabitans luteus]|uniref:LppX_LprAFG lipoprotein n=1 Tax=Sediminihabitans luteus TaxID=1138585 RepID=A0A2M9CBY2_9CELL|nr:hypothetical protein [Sediminihabitans luteus]PJJ68553.1 hypothetical protein CLV28_2969 [Sediminihabitans luteus]GII99888.1 hypothetical protein Slu03_22660 [Sediminihabitans luteus]
MRSARRFAVLSVPLALAGALTLAGCASDDAPADAPSATSQGDDDASPAAEEVTEEAAEESGDVLTQDEFFETYVDATVNAGSYTQTMDMAGTVMQADIVMHDGTTDMDMTMSGEGGDGVHMIFVDGRAFYDVAGYTDGFVEVDMDDPDDPMGVSFAQTIDQLDPHAAIAPIKDALTSFKAVDATEELDGTTAREYVLGVDSTAIAASGGLTEEDAAAAQLPDELEYHLWLGVDDDLPRKMSYSFAGVEFVTIMTDYDGGQVVEAPSADEMSTRAGS